MFFFQAPYSQNQEIEHELDSTFFSKTNDSNSRRHNNRNLGKVVLKGESSPPWKALQKGLLTHHLTSFGGLESCNLPSLKLTWHLKMDGWNTSFLLGWPIFRCHVRFRECNPHFFVVLKKGEHQRKKPCTRMPGS